MQEYEAARIWGIEGSIDVDPKYFKPRLNRESFVAEEFGPQVTDVLRRCHPVVLTAMVTPLIAAFESGALGKWNRRRWASLWLSIPRTTNYAETTQAWDAVFSTIPAFEMAVGDGWEPASLERIERFKDDVYVAPLADERSSDVVSAAVRFLRNTGKPVIRGLRYDKSWMRHASRSFATTADLVSRVFSDRIPKLVRVSNVAQQVLASIDRLAPLFTGPPVVDVVRLGPESVPVLRLAGRLVINVDHDAGRKILEDALRENRGPVSLLASTAKFASEHLTQVATAVSVSAGPPEILSPIRRRFIRSRTA